MLSFDDWPLVIRIFGLFQRVSCIIVVTILKKISYIEADIIYVNW